MITEPEVVLFSALFHPLVLMNGHKIYMIETTRCYWADTMPVFRDAANKPMVLHEEIGIGSVVRLAIRADGTVEAVRIIAAVWNDPFADQ